MLGSDSMCAAASSTSSIIVVYSSVFVRSGLRPCTVRRLPWSTNSGVKGSLLRISCCHQRRDLCKNMRLCQTTGFGVGACSGWSDNNIASRKQARTRFGAKMRIAPSKSGVDAAGPNREHDFQEQGHAQAASSERAQKKLQPHRTQRDGHNRTNSSHKPDASRTSDAPKALDSTQQSESFITLDRAGM